MLSAGASLIASATLSPTLFHGVWDSHPEDAPPWTWDQIYEAVHPITLSSPDPFKRPDKLGDGGNQYVFGGDSDAVLKIPVAAEVTGGGEDDAKFLINYPNTATSHVDFKVTPQIASTISGSPFTHDLTATGSSISVQTQGVDNSNQPWPAGFFIYEGLRHSFSTVADGNHEVTLTVDGNDTETAHIQTFFKGTSFNHHDSDTDSAGNNYNTPNWYHYYKPIYAPSGDYRPGPQTQTDPTAPYAVHIEDQTYQEENFRVYALKPGDAYISYAGNITAKGVLMYIFSCAHEKEHHDACTNGTYAIDTTQPAHPTKATGDLDSLDDTWETNHHFKASDSNTTKAPAYPNEVDQPDDEVIADIVGLGTLLDNKSKWRQDWADGGVQMGMPPVEVPPGAVPPNNGRDLYLMFTPATQDPQDPSGHTWINGTPVKIWSKQNLESLVPGVLTALP